MRFLNLTPHVINLNDGTTIEPSGTIARVSQTYEPFVNGISNMSWGLVEGLPAPAAGVVYITSLVVAQSVASHRDDVVSPATNHPDTIRDEKGRIVSVPGFVRSPS